jgi:hypothetical protein
MALYCWLRQSPDATAAALYGAYSSAEYAWEDHLKARRIADWEGEMYSYVISFLFDAVARLYVYAPLWMLNSYFYRFPVEYIIKMPILKHKQVDIHKHI